MAEFTPRKIAIHLERIRHDGGPIPARSWLRRVVLAVTGTPFADRREARLRPAGKALKPREMRKADRLIAIVDGLC